MRIEVKLPRRKRTTQAERDEAVQMYVDGHRAMFIVEKIGISTFTLYRELARRGIPKRTDPTV